MLLSVEGTTRMDEGVGTAARASGYVVALRIARLAEGTRVEVDCAPSLDHREEKTTLIFEGAIDIRIGDLGPYGWSELTITAIRHWGWDRIGYALEDTENEVIALKCEQWRRGGA